MSTRIVPAVVFCLGAAAAAAGQPVARLRGTDFAGGAAHVYGTVQNDTADVNYVYARPTGTHASMRAKFRVAAIPGDAVFLHVMGRDDDAAAPCPIKIRLNGQVVFAGPSGFPGDAWAWRRFPLPAGALRTGDNELVIANAAAEGQMGMPPWFMVGRAALAGERFDANAPVRIEEDFRVDLPATPRPFPEPLPEGARPGFQIRGTKGWMWKPAQYLAEIPVLARYKLNFLMNCYGSMCDIEHYPWGHKQCNRWWEPLPDEKKQAYEQVVRACQKAGIQFCFSMNPNLGAARFVSARNPQDMELLYRHYAWMQGLGVKWFNVSLDDISQGIDAADQARAVNEVFHRLRAGDPQAEMVFCPTFYWGTGDDAKAAEYLATIAEVLDREIYCFWTGGSVVGHITRSEAQAYRNRIKHRIIVWDNYPVNDGHPTLHLGPVIHRDPDLGEVVDGIMGNPLCPQNEINRIPLLTLADYAWNPRAYDPARSIGQAILQLAETPGQREVLRELVELYPGMLLEGKATSYNPVQARFAEIVARPHSRFLADLFLRHVEDVAGRLDRAFPATFQDAGKTLAGDIARLKTAYRAHYGLQAPVPDR
jgi:hypothetical protein